MVRDPDAILSDSQPQLTIPPVLSPLLSPGEATQKVDSFAAVTADTNEVPLNMTDSITSLRASEISQSVCTCILTTLSTLKFHHIFIHYEM